MAKILVVEDEPDFSVLVASFLNSEHHATEVAETGEAALDLLAVYKYDLIVLDWNLPGMSGLDVCKHFRAQGGITPIIMLTARAHVDEKSAGLDSGADDYLTKPFQIKELGSRVRALLRRPTAFQANNLRAGSLEMDLTNFRVRRGEEEIALLPKEFALLEFFMRHPNQVFSPETLTESGLRTRKLRPKPSALILNGSVRNWTWRAKGLYSPPYTALDINLKINQN